MVMKRGERLFEGSNLWTYLHDKVKQITLSKMLYGKSSYGIILKIAIAENSA